METEETIGETAGKYRKVLCCGKEEERERERRARSCRGAETSEVSEKAAELGIKKPLEGNVYKGMVAEARFLLQSRGPRIYEANLYSIQQNF